MSGSEKSWKRGKKNHQYWSWGGRDGTGRAFGVHGMGAAGFFVPFQWRTSGSTSTGRNFGGPAAAIPGTEEDVGGSRTQLLAWTASPPPRGGKSHLRGGLSRRKRGWQHRGEDGFAPLRAKRGENKIEGDRSGVWGSQLGVGWGQGLAHPQPERAQHSSINTPSAPDKNPK